MRSWRWPPPLLGYSYHLNGGRRSLFTLCTYYLSEWKKEKLYWGVYTENVFFFSFFFKECIKGFWWNILYENHGIFLKSRILPCMRSCGCTGAPEVTSSLDLSLLTFTTIVWVALLYCRYVQYSLNIYGMAWYWPEYKI